MMFNWLSMIAGICYIALGIIVLFYKFLAMPLDSNVAYMLGALLIAYGIFRIIRTIKRFRDVKNEE